MRGDGLGLPLEKARDIFPLDSRIDAVKKYGIKVSDVITFTDLDELFAKASSIVADGGPGRSPHLHSKFYLESGNK